MPTTARASLVFALTALLLAGCGGDSSTDSPDDGATATENRGCTERDGAWFGRSESGAMITSQTREACEERLGQ